MWRNLIPISLSRWEFYLGSSMFFFQSCVEAHFKHTIISKSHSFYGNVLNGFYFSNSEILKTYTNVSSPGQWNQIRKSSFMFFFLSSLICLFLCSMRFLLVCVLILDKKWRKYFSIFSCWTLSLKCLHNLWTKKNLCVKHTLNDIIIYQRGNGVMTY